MPGVFRNGNVKFDFLVDGNLITYSGKYTASENVDLDGVRVSKIKATGDREKEHNQIKSTYRAFRDFPCAEQWVSERIAKRKSLQGSVYAHETLTAEQIYDGFLHVCNKKILHGGLTLYGVCEHLFSDDLFLFAYSQLSEEIATDNGGFHFIASIKRDSSANAAKVPIYINPARIDQSGILSYAGTTNIFKEKCLLFFDKETALEYCMMKKNERVMVELQKVQAKIAKLTEVSDKISSKISTDVSNFEEMFSI
jgi:hypothetical protein